MKRALCLCLSAVLGPLAAAERAPAAGWLGNLTYTASGTARWVENLSRTSAVANRQDAATYDLDLTATQHRQLAPAWLLHAGAEAGFHTEPDFRRADQLTAGLRLGLQRKFGLGPLAPVLLLETSWNYRDSRLAADRGTTSTATLSLSKRLTPELRASVRGFWLEHNARSRTFDLNQRGYSAEISWDATEHWTLSGSAGRTSGDIVANAAGAVWAQAISGGLGATVFNYYTSRPWEVTHLYGPNWVSYNVQADVDLWSLAAAYSLSDRTTAELRCSSAFVVNRIGVRYPTDSWGLSLVHRF